MKLSKIVDKKFKKAMEDIQAQKMPIQTSWTLAGIFIRVQEEQEKYDHVRNGLLKQYGSKKKDGSLEINANGNINFTQENLKVFMSEINKLLDIDVELPTVKLADLGNIVISPEEIIALKDIITP